MKKLFVIAILFAAVLPACGSSVSDATQAGASELISNITATLTESLEGLKNAENAQSAAEVADNFQTALASYVLKDGELMQKSDYALINTDKKIQGLIEELAAAMHSFRRSIGGESDAYHLAAHAAPAARAMQDEFEGLKVYPITWLNSCTEARNLIEGLTDLMNTSFVSLRDAKDSSTAGSVLIAYANGIRDLSARGAELEEKYPEFKKAATDSSLEKPVANLRAAMVDLGKEINARAKEFEKDADYQNARTQMKEILDSIKR